MHKINKITIGAAVIALIIGYGIGYFTHPASTPAQGTRGNFSGMGGENFAGRTGGGANGGGMLSGTVAAQDPGSITLNTRDGSSRVVLITPATTIQKSVGGSLTDVLVGSTIIVTGTTNGDGSVSASSIQLRPAMPTAAPQPQ